MYIVQFLTIFAIQYNALALWNKDEIACPLTCTCRVELFTEISIRRFIKLSDLQINSASFNNNNNNEVVRDGTGDEHAYPLDGNAESDADADADAPENLVYTAICVLQTETDIMSLLDQLPSTLGSLTLIQGTDAGSKTVRISAIKSRFVRLHVLELRSQTNITTQVGGLTCVFDEILPQLMYANFEHTKLVNGRQDGVKIATVYNRSIIEAIVQYTQPLENGKALTFLQQYEDIQRPPILPYWRYRHDFAHAQITFAGFDRLRLMRITHAHLNTINYDMFVGLNSLHHLLLQDNDLRIIPEFAFYGTPNLKSLSLAGNNLLTIRIADLAGLMHLEYLDLARNNFTELSEVSLPPFPTLKLVNLADNPIAIIYPNTFEVLNTTKSLIVGGTDMPLKLMSNAFVGLVALDKLTVLNLRMDTLERDVFIGMGSLVELELSAGYIMHIAFDTFIDCTHLERLIVSGCHIYNISVDAFLGLSKLRHLDLSDNNLDTISAATFDGLRSIREIHLSNNRLRQLPADLFVNVKGTVKVVRLDGNPWHCSCDAMINWRPTTTNRIKVAVSVARPCTHAPPNTATQHKLPLPFNNDSTNTQQHDINETIDGGRGGEEEEEECAMQAHAQYNQRGRYKYVYDVNVSPRCEKPRRYANLTVYQVMRKMHCARWHHDLHTGKKRIQQQQIVRNGNMDDHPNHPNHLQRGNVAIYARKSHGLNTIRRRNNRFSQKNDIDNSI